ncbi:hypothetical protein [Morganella morganii IS15]|nr:hypothetical protein CSB69_3281 [Morganella morganii]CDK63920.1 hypothetical protein [Morganella morganii IS15]
MDGCQWCDYTAVTTFLHCTNRNNSVIPVFLFLPAVNAEKGCVAVFFIVQSLR